MNRFDYKNPQLEVEDRVKCLLGLMTLDEKVRQMDMYAGSCFVDKMSPASRTCVAEDGKFIPEKAEEIIGELGIGCIHDLYPMNSKITNEIQKYCRENTRLGIPVLFSEEALHGLGGLGNTIFPQAISTAGTWNRELAQKIGGAIASEMRAKGLHLAFSPVLDIARDPRWGRTEETFGEDPYLAGVIGTAIVKGMQGESLNTDHTIIAEPKHYGAHSVPQGGLNTNACSLGERELKQTFLSVFKKAIIEGGAMSVMCAYHANDGVPCVADKWLLTDVLRGEWGFKGFVCSDLGAINRLHTMHRTADTPVEAIRQAVEAGVDMQFFDFDHEMFQNSIINLVKEWKLGIEAVDRAVGCVLRVKFMLGLFDNPYIDEELSQQVTRSASHQEIALQAARESICLLKNDNNLLPLKKTLKSIAVIGPSADVARMGDYSPPAYGFKPVTVLEGIKSVVSPETQVVYEKGTEIVSGELKTIQSQYLFALKDGLRGLRGEYFNNVDFAGQPDLIRVDPVINFNWVMGLVDNSIRSDQFSVRWEGKLIPDKTQEGLIGVVCNDHMKLWIDGSLVIDNGSGASALIRHGKFEFIANREYDIKVEYCKKRGGGAIVRLGWNFDTDRLEEAVLAATGKDVAVVVVGESEHTCGEGFDRSDLVLPGKQLALVQAVEATGTPVIVVLMNGRPLTVNWIAENIHAVIEAWYPGEKGGKAIAEVLFGDCNPSGRLPVTMPKSVGQLPLYYSMLYAEQKHYVDMDSSPLFRFGYGLSYTTFSYENLTVTPEKATADQPIRVSVEVLNTGEQPGDEVVQLYVKDIVSSIVTPEKQLKGFERVFLNPGQRRRVEFILGKEELALLDRKMNPVVEAGSFEIMVGGNSERGVKARFEII